METYTHITWISKSVSTAFLTCLLSVIKSRHNVECEIRKALNNGQPLNFATVYSDWSKCEYSLFSVYVLVSTSECG